MMFIMLILVFLLQFHQLTPIFKPSYAWEHLQGQGVHSVHGALKHGGLPSIQI
jgi:hypothetical protein